MVIIEVTERVTLSHGEDDDIIKFYENLCGWNRSLGDTNHVTFERTMSISQASDDYRKMLREVKADDSN